MSFAPPGSTSPAGGPREFVLPVKAERGRLGRTAAEGRVVLSPLGLVLEHPRCLVPLRLSLGALALAAVEHGGPRAQARFPVLRRVGPDRIIPREEGIEGWLWTDRGGSGLAVLCDEGTAPNLAFVLAQPLGEDVVAHAFDSELVRALAARSPLGAPSLYGLLLRVPDPGLAERTLSRFCLLKPLTDREVPKTLRRSLPTDRPADPQIVPAGARADATRSVAPPGL